MLVSNIEQRIEKIEEIFVSQGNKICISVLPHTAVMLAIISLSKSLSPKYLRFSL